MRLEVFSNGSLGNVVGGKSHIGDVDRDERKGL